MGLVDVTFTVLSSAGSAPVNNVLVRVFTPAGAFVTQGLTGVSYPDGEVVLELDGVADPGTPYIVRMVKDGWYFPPDNYFEINAIDPPAGGDNEYTYSATLGTGDETVVINVLDDTPSQNPVASVQISVYDENGGFLTQVLTDSAGSATLSLPGAADPGQAYTLGFRKTGVSFEYPVQQILVLPQDNLGAGVEGFGVGGFGSSQPFESINTFDIEAHVRELPESEDPALCRLSGYVADVGLAGVKNAVIRFKPSPELSVAIPDHNGLPVVGAKIPVTEAQAKADSDGYIEVDLIRGQAYRAHIYGMEAMDRIIRLVRIPEAAGWDLAEVLLPYVLLVEMGVDQAVNVGDTYELVPTIYMSDGHPSDIVLEWVTFSSSDEAVATVVAKDDETLEISAIGAGTAVISATRNPDQLYPRYPALPEIDESITVVVS